MSESKSLRHPDEIKMDMYLDQELTDVESNAIEAHLSECADCREYIDSRRAFFGLIIESEELSISSDVTVEVIDSLQRSRWRLLAGVLSLEAALAAFLLLLLGSQSVARISGEFGRARLRDSILWFGDSFNWISAQLQAGLLNLSEAIELVPPPLISSFPEIQLNWLHWGGILTGIFLLWVLVNRVLIESTELQRSRYS